MDGIVVFSEEIVVTSTPRIPVPPPGTSIPPPTAPTQPTTPTPPSFPRALWPQQLRDAVDDAITKSETCSVRTNSGDLKNANAKLTAAKDAGRVVPGGPLCDGETAAHTDDIPGTTIHVCSEFFDQSATVMSLAIMHEGCILVGSAGSVSVRAYGVSRSEAQECLDRLGLLTGAVADPDVSIYGSDAFSGVQEAGADWATKRLELNGKFALRQTTEVLGRAMTVTSVVGSDGLLTTDARGGSRIVAYRKFPLATCTVSREGNSVSREGNYCADATSFDAARDDRGTIVAFVRDREGLPGGVRFGETLLLRYDFTPPLPDPPARAGDRWREPSSWELVDLRTSEIVVDSADAAEVASERSRLSVYFRGIGEVLRIEDGQPFAVAEGIRQAPHALIPLETVSDVWRSVYANGDWSWRYKFRVDYTDDLVRAEIKATEYGKSIVVEAPRSRDSVAPASIVHPGQDRLTDAVRSGVRLRPAVPVETWLETGFDKESLPIVLRPLHYRGTERGPGSVLGVSRTAARVAAPEFDFGLAAGCEEEAGRIVCPGGKADVIGEESSYPW